MDATDRLWGEGLEILADITLKRDQFSGRPSSAARSVLGRFMKQAGNDAERVLGAIIAAA